MNKLSNLRWTFRNTTCKHFYNQIRSTPLQISLKSPRHSLRSFNTQTQTINQIEPVKKETNNTFSSDDVRRDDANTSVIHQDTIKNYIKSGDIYKAIEFLNSALRDSNFVDLKTYNLLILACLEKELIFDAAHFQQILKDNKVNPDPTNLEIWFSNIESHFDENLTLYLCHQIFKPSFNFISSIANAFLTKFKNNSNFAQIDKLYNEIEKRGLIDEEICTTLVSAFGGIGNLSKAKEIIETMKKLGIPFTNNFCFTVLASTPQEHQQEMKNLLGNMNLENIQNSEKAVISMMRKIDTQDVKFAENLQNFLRAIKEPRITIFNEAIQILSTHRLTKEINNILRIMENLNIKPDDYTYIIMMNAFKKANEIVLMGDTLNEMINREIPRSVIYTIIFSGEPLPRIKNFYKTMISEDISIRSSCYENYIENFISTYAYSVGRSSPSIVKNRQLVAQYYKYITSKTGIKLPEEFYWSVLELCFSYGDFEEQVLQNIVSLFHQDKRLIQRKYTEILASKSWKLALCFLNKLYREGIKEPISFLSHVRLDSSETLKKILDIAKAQNITLDRTSLDSAIGYLGNSSDKSEVIKLFEEYASKGIKPSSVVCCKILKYYIQMGFKEKAVSLFADMAQNGPVPSPETAKIFIFPLFRSFANYDALILIYYFNLKQNLNELKLALSDFELCSDILIALKSTNRLNDEYEFLLTTVDPKSPTIPLILKPLVSDQIKSLNAFTKDLFAKLEKDKFYQIAPFFIEKLVEKEKIDSALEFLQSFKTSSNLNIFEKLEPWLTKVEPNLFLSYLAKYPALEGLYKQGIVYFSSRGLLKETLEIYSIFLKHHNPDPNLLLLLLVCLPSGFPGRDEIPDLIKKLMIKKMFPDVAFFKEAMKRLKTTDHDTCFSLSETYLVERNVPKVKGVKDEIKEVVLSGKYLDETTLLLIKFAQKYPQEVLDMGLDFARSNVSAIAFEALFEGAASKPDVPVIYELLSLLNTLILMRNQLTTKMFQTIIQVLANQEWIEELMWALKEMEKAGVRLNKEILDCAIPVLYKKRDWQTIVNLFQKSQESRIPLDPICIKYALTSFTRLGLPTENIIEKLLSNDSIEVPVSIGILKVFGALRMLPKLREYFSSLLKKGFKGSEVLEVMAIELIRNGEFKEGINNIKRATKAISTKSSNKKTFLMSMIPNIRAFWRIRESIEKMLKNAIS